MSETMKSRNSSIDLLKFYFAVIIVLFHFGQDWNIKLFPLGYLSVEFFFMISGYFMMNSVHKAKNENIGADTLKFIVHKFSSFSLPLFFSALIAFISMSLINSYTLYEFITRPIYLLGEFLPLQITGLRTVPITRVSWYLSSMMISLFILYPLARKASTVFTRVICPVSVFLIYGALCYKYGRIDVITELFYGTPIHAGLLRGIAGICMGCMIFDCVKSSEHHKASRFGKWFFAGIEILCIAVITVFMFFFPQAETDYYILPVFFVLLYSLFGKKSVLSERISFKFSEHFGKASLLIYLNHHFWNLFMQKFIPEHPLKIKFTFYLVAIVCSCIVVSLATTLTKLIWKKVKPFFKKHFISN